MKKLLVLVIALAIVSSAMANVSIRRHDGYYKTGVSPYYTGGEYTLHSTELASEYGVYYSSKAKYSDGSLQSFCVEFDENVSSWEWYSYSIDTYAIKGGTDTTTPSGYNKDTLSVATQWLYYNFAKGTLDYEYDDISADNDSDGVWRADDAKDLQEAIWFLEEEYATSSNKYLDAAMAEFGASDYASLQSLFLFDISGYGYLANVKVLNPYDSNLDPECSEYYKQSQLILVPTPGAILLGSLGVSLVGALRRRRKI
jgi:hypothetical protein